MGKLRKAATVILLQDGEKGPELFMMQRHIKSDFVGGAYVFPGGVLDPDDEIDQALCAGRTDDSASATLGIEQGGLAYWVAAIRECFEEAGVLFAYRSDGRMLDFGPPAVEERFRSYRDALNRGELSMAEMLRQEDLRLATDRVHYWAHWITPEGQPLRYDTRFFLAIAPDRQVAAHDGWELTNSSWVTPQRALERAEAREWMVILPTMRNLMLLRDFRNAADAEQAARSLQVVETIQPRVIKDASGTRFVLPGEPDYEEGEKTTTETNSTFLENALKGRGK